MIIGYRTITDRDGPLMARAFYEALMNDTEDVISSDDIPYALDSAVKKLRSKAPAYRWASFIHMGA